MKKVEQAVSGSSIPSKAKIEEIVDASKEELEAEFSANDKGIYYIIFSFIWTLIATIYQLRDYKLKSMNLYFLTIY